MEELLTEHLYKISNDYEAILSVDHKRHLNRLKSSGVDPLIIYDIGAGSLTWTRYAQSLWPDALFYVFEAADFIEPFYKDIGVNYNIYVLSNNHTVKFYQNEYYFFSNSYYREVDYQSFSYYDLNDYVEKTTHKLDTIVEKNDFPWADLININVQGAEKDVIEGGLECLSHAEHLIVNMFHEESKLLAPRVYTTLPYICSLGWKCYAPFFADNGTDGDYGFVKI